MEQKEKMIDVTSVELTPGDSKRCKGNGEHPDFECCCDECNYYLACFPEWDSGGTAWQEQPFPKA